VEALVFTKDGRCLVSGSHDGTVRLWDVAHAETSAESRPLRGHAAMVFDVAVSPDGGTVASASGDATIRLWPVKLPPPAGQLRRWLEAKTDFRIEEANR
jgi:WD40 repeat protein